MTNDGDQQILGISRGDVSPDSVDAIYQEAGRFVHFERKSQTADAFLLEFEVLQ